MNACAVSEQGVHPDGCAVNTDMHADDMHADMLPTCMPVCCQQPTPRHTLKHPCIILPYLPGLGILGRNRSIKPERFQASAAKHHSFEPRASLEGSEWQELEA